LNGSEGHDRILIFDFPFAIRAQSFHRDCVIPLSVSGCIGFIALFGQAVLNGVVMVSYFSQLQDEGLTPYESVLQGATTRLRTVLTTLLAILGLLPMALSHGIGSETQRPLAIVIIGGLVSATLLTLMVLPTLYLVFEQKTKRLATSVFRHGLPDRALTEGSLRNAFIANSIR